MATKERYRIFRRGSVFYLHDKTTGKQRSLRVRDKVEAQRLAMAHNQAVEQPALNLLMAKAYLAGRSAKLGTRTWNEAIDELAKSYDGTTARRWHRFARSQPISHIRSLPIVETESSDFLAVLRHPRAGTSTNVWLRRLHNFTLDMGWLLSPVLHKRLWPKIKYQKRYAISQTEHEAIIASEKNEERRLYYEMLWLTGGSQGDIAELSHLNVHKEAGLLAYTRQKLKGRHEDLGVARLAIGEKLQGLLSRLPTSGYFFPHIRRDKSQHRSTEFSRRCRIAGVKGRSLHGYRYGWAERACNSGMPEREAMRHLGHKSAAVHRAYALKADAPILPLEHYERERQRLILNSSGAGSPPPHKAALRP